jgi:hypothetical protein
MRSTSWAASAAGAGAAAVLGVVAYATLVEPRRLRVRRASLALPHWPAALDGLRLVLVSDLHTGAPHVPPERLDRIVARANALGGDLIALLGDHVDHEVTFGQAPEPGDVAARLARLRAPLGVLAVLGNHDWRTDGEGIRAALDGAGVRVLEDEAVRVAREPAELWVTGLADASERSPDVARALAAVPADAAVLALSHDPDLFPRIPARVALTVSGHVHGGQVAIPRLRARWTPSRFGERYVDGHVVEDGRHLFVTSGVGTSNHPVRLGAPPELVVLTLRTRGASGRSPGARRRARSARAPARP